MTGSRLVIVALVAALVVVFLFSTISQFKLLLLSNFLYGVIAGGVIGAFAGYRYAKKRFTSSTRL